MRNKERGTGGKRKMGRLGDAEELRDRPPALKGFWPGGEIGKFNHSITHSLNHSILLPPV
jgi:hypothetical protein